MQIQISRFLMLYIGADYYPEHWERKRWPIDAELMQKAGLNVVRLAEFACSRLEPENRRYEFNWLDEVGTLENSLFMGFL